MKCEKYLDMMSLYIDNRLEAQELEDFEEHIINCSSCQEELNILKEIVNDINELEELELPERFHQELMSKIQTKPSQRWKIISAIAAAFLITAIAVDRLQLNTSKNAIPDSLTPESANVQMELFIAEEAMPKMAQDRSAAKNEIEIKTNAYDSSKDIIDQVFQDMNFQEETIEEVVVDGRRELTLQLALTSSEKHQFISRIQELSKDITITSQEVDDHTEALDDDVRIIFIRLIEAK